MLKRVRFQLILPMLVTVFVLSAMWTVPALADDGTPPVDAPVTVTDPTLPTVDSTAEPIIDSSTTESNAVAELQSQLPEGTEIVITDATGQALPLASEQAAQTVVDHDPMWCPAGVTPIANVGGCSGSFPRFGPSTTGDINTELLKWLETNNPGKAGTIWIHGDYDSGTDETTLISPSITLDGSTLTNMAKYALTLQGGWTGSGKTVDQFNPSEFNASLTIQNWIGAVTLNDILITGATVNPNFGTSATSALIVETKQAITLNRVQVTDSGPGLNGADLANYGAGTLAPITVNDSQFNHNAGDGLRVLSDGTITIRNLTVNYNGQNGVLDYGAFISNLNANAGKGITFTGSSQFRGNLGSGTYLASWGAITLNNITAYANGDATNTSAENGTGILIGGSASIKMTGTNVITYNLRNGLDLTSNGIISLNNINASNNGGGGAVLNNCIKSGSTCTVVGKPVTLTGTNTFNWNTLEGLVVETDGTITISNVTASHNGSFGVFLDNCAFSGSACTNTLPYAISITSPSSFLYNTNDGLYIRTTGAVTLNSITANFNQNRGVFIDNHASLSSPQAITIKGTNFINGNDNTGLRMVSYGAITLNNITANDNGRVDLCANTCAGAYIDNLAYSNPLVGSILITRQPFTLTGTNTFNNNYSGGLVVYSAGNITVTNITASRNGVAGTGDGVYLTNNWDWHPNSAVATTAYSANITLNGYGVFDGNGDEGLQVFSRGIINLNNVTSTGNNGYGVYLDNRGYTAGVIAVRQPVTLLGVNTFNNNLGGGAYIYTLGVVTLNNVTAIGNKATGSGGSGHGIYVNNNWTWLPNGVTNTVYAANVTLKGYGFFEGNTDDGLEVLSKGTVLLNTVTANSNGDNGVRIVNTGTTLTQNVTLSGTNSFYGNGFTSTTGNGLFVQTDGTITISNLSAIGNKGNGAWLDNFTDKKPSKFLGVTLTGITTFQSNQGANGLYVNTDGSVTMTNFTADDNSGNGVQILATKNVTLTCGNAYSNTGTGYLLTSGGVMTLKGLYGYSNGTEETLTYGSLVRTRSCP
ncbi:MAG: hypothetical protein U0Z26_06905 [Anaerolineales bacterium]